MSPDDLARLLADLPEPDGANHLDAGLLGEYLYARRQHGASLVGEYYPRVEAHLRTECPRCTELLEAIRAFVWRPDRDTPPATPAPPADQSRAESDEVTASGEHEPIPEPLEIAEAIALGRAIEAEREALRAPLRPDRTGQIDLRRQAARRRTLLLVEAALIRQRLAARRLFLDRARALLTGGPSASAPQSSPHPPGPPIRRGPGGARFPVMGRQPNPKAHLLLDDFADGVNDLARASSRLSRLIVDLRRIGDDPRGPARSQSEALTNRGLALAREGLMVDRKLAPLQGILSGMAT